MASACEKLIVDLAFALTEFKVQGKTMSIANNIDYGGAFSHPCVAGAAPSELEVMLMSTVSAVPQGDESFEQGGQRGV